MERSAQDLSLRVSFHARSHLGFIERTGLIDPRPFYLPFQSLWADLRLLCFINGLKYSELTTVGAKFNFGKISENDRVNLDQYPFGKVAHRRLLALLATEPQPERQYRQLKYWCPKKNLSYIECRVLKYCPKCIVHNFHSTAYQMPWVRKCPTHGDELLSRCPNCNATLYLERAVATPACTCGWDAVEPQQFNCSKRLVVDEQSFRQFLDFVSLVNERIYPQDRFPPTLLGMGFCDTLEDRVESDDESYAIQSIWDELGLKVASRMIHELEYADVLQKFIGVETVRSSPENISKKSFVIRSSIEKGAGVVRGPMSDLLRNVAYENSLYKIFGLPDRRTEHDYDRVVWAIGVVDSLFDTATSLTEGSCGIRCAFWQRIKNGSEIAASNHVCSHGRKILQAEANIRNALWGKGTLSWHHRFLSSHAETGRNQLIWLIQQDVLNLIWSELIKCAVIKINDISESIFSFDKLEESQAYRQLRSARNVTFLLRNADSYDLHFVIEQNVEGIVAKMSMQCAID